METHVVTEALEPAENAAAPSSDVADVRAAAAGDSRAFERLVRRHQQAVVDAATYHLGDYQDALEVAQESFVKAHRALDRFRGDAQFRTWLLRITLNTARSFHTRRTAKKRSAPIISIHQNAGGADGDSDGASFDIADFGDTPDSLLERKELKEALEAAIASLETEARDLVVLRDIVGESYEAIAQQFDLPLGTVKSKVHRARLVLREKLAKSI